MSVIHYINATFNSQKKINYPQGLNFHNWISKSKVIDKKGKPIIVYRGSDKLSLDLDESDLGHSTGAPSAREGFFFTSRKKTAIYYSRGQNPNLKSSYRNGGRPHVGEYYLLMKNPIIYDYKGKRFREKSYYSLIIRAKKLGHDGVIFKNTYDAGEYGALDGWMRGRFFSEDVYVVFNPAQVKLKSIEYIRSETQKITETMEKVFRKRVLYSIEDFKKALYKRIDDSRVKEKNIPNLIELINNVYKDINSVKEKDILKLGEVEMEIRIVLLEVCKAIKGLKKEIFNHKDVVEFLNHNERLRLAKSEYEIIMRDRILLERLIENHENFNNIKKIYNQFYANFRIFFKNMISIETEIR